MNEQPTSEAHHGDHTHEHHGHHHGHGHHGPSVKTYMAVFGALVVCTLVSFVANVGVRQGVIGPLSSFGVIMTVAVIKALLVAYFFMHLIVDWRKVYIFIVPTLILGPLMVVVLLPDIVLAWNR
jgi:caa(3)-type oxidase subunit IV